MPSGQGPMVAGALLTSELVRLRKGRKLTQNQVAQQLEWSTSKIIRIEGGKTPITRSDLQVLLLQYGVSDAAETEKLQDLAREARTPGWWDEYRDEVEESEFLEYVGYEAGAAAIKSYQASLVPGILQTREYAEVIAEHFHLGAVKADSTVKFRLRRQVEMSKRERPPLRSFVIDEGVIRRQVGVKSDPLVMPNQLRHLVDEATHNDAITIRVVPFSVGAHSGMRGPFTILEFDGPLEDILYLEGGRRGDQTIKGQDSRITDYTEAFESLLEESLSPRESLRVITEVAAEMAP
jgi:transcriptional regulator with XRE-family HTH domain